MKTEFKIFESDLGYYKVEELIKEYQEKHNAEIKNVVLIKKYDDEIVFGVVFEESSEYKELEDRRYRSTKWLYSE